MGALKLRLPGSQLAIHGRRTNRRTFVQGQCRRAQNEWLGLPAAEATMRADQFLEPGDFLGRRVESAQKDQISDVGKAVKVEKVLGSSGTVGVQRVRAFTVRCG